MDTKKILAIVIFLAMILTIIALFLIDQKYKIIIVSIPKFQHDVKSPTPVPPVLQSQISNLKSSILLPVPFTPQAPTANWDILHNEDCEEAGSIMANAYFNGPHDAKLDAAYVENLLTKITDWEMNVFGYNLNITSEETIKMITANFNLQAKMLNNFTEDDIKKELAQNHLILLPANGQLLGNPNYKQPGPKYHMLVIRGYTSSSIITNDPGTRNGLNYYYSFDTLYNANGNWNHQTNSVDLNNKNIIVIWK